MAKLQLSTKRLQIDKANARLVVITAVAAFVATFSLVASRTLLSQRAYQSRVISQKEKAVRQLNDNVRAVDQLKASYRQFVSTTENVLGGNPAGQGDKDGDNAKIVLDALPSKYDFPALATSLEKILTERNYKIESITGTDDEIAQAKSTSPEPQPVDMPFEIGVEGTFDSMQSLINVLELSIRPFHIQKFSFSAEDSALALKITGKTYYQPAKDLSITTKVVK